MRKLGLLTVGLSATIVIAGAAGVLLRERTLAGQRQQGYPASGRNEGARDLYSHTVLGVGGLFLTFDSTGHDSALWQVRPGEMFSPLHVESLVRWNDPGRVAWSATGNSSADLVIEFAPETNHRVAVLRATCSGGTCRTTTQERGIPNGTKLFIGADGSALLLSPTTSVVYASIADLMRDTGARETSRLLPREDGELVAHSRDATLLLTTPQSLTGELIAGPSHAAIRLEVDSGGTAVAIALSDGLQMVIAGNGSTQLWDCPASVLAGGGECTVYSAPSTFSRPVAVPIHDTECGIVVAGAGSTWLVRRNAKTGDVVAGDGVVRCAPGETVTFGARHIDYRTPAWRSVSSQRRTLRLLRSSSQ